MKCDLACKDCYTCMISVNGLTDDHGGSCVAFVVVDLGFSLVGIGSTWWNMK